MATDSATAGNPGARAHRRLPVVLGVATVLLGGLAVWSHQQAQRLEGTATARNAALTDNARTSEVKGEITSAVNTVFSYNYLDIAKTQRAAQTSLTGKAILQYNAMLGLVREQAPGQKTVLTTTVTDSAVKTLHGDRARLLIFADQRNTRTAGGQTSYAAAMLAVDAVRQGGHWKISAIDTFTGAR
jgi:Mce-associated membrane protein